MHDYATKKFSGSIGELTFGDSLLKPQLQAADMLAGRLCWVNEQFLIKGASDVHQKAWEKALFKNPNKNLLVKELDRVRVW